RHHRELAIAADHLYRFKWSTSSDDLLEHDGEAVNVTFLRAVHFRLAHSQMLRSCPEKRLYSGEMVVSKTSVNYKAFNSPPDTYCTAPGQNFAWRDCAASSGQSRST